jgi:catechol 2,3-dioxygenase-like lactoylglutathione lyase family enzyme
LAECAEFYGEVLGLPLLFEFRDHDGYSGMVFGLPDRSVQLELVQRDGATAIPEPDPENQIVFYLPGDDAAAEIHDRLRARGLEPVVPENTYWVRRGAFAFADPDGWIVIFAP